MPSRYTEQYLNQNQSRGGYGEGITPGTFLSYQLSGRAMKYKARYQRALERDLDSRDDVIGGPSKTGASAYYWKEAEPKTEGEGTK
jgi:hypothetical protein